MKISQKRWVEKKKVEEEGKKVVGQSNHWAEL
jgi:hypothetical protein